jgi:hypothetical protein
MTGQSDFCNAFSKKPPLRGESDGLSDGNILGTARLVQRRFGASQSGDLVLELKFPSLEFCQPHVICRRSVEGILNFALDGPMLPFQFRQVILQRHVSSSYGDLLTRILWQNDCGESKAKFEESRREDA